MKHCKKCHSSYTINNKNHKDIRLSNQAMTLYNQYGLPQMNSSTQVILKDDCYLLRILSKTHRKTQKLERSLSKMKLKIKHLQKNLEQMQNYPKSQNRKAKQYELLFEQQYKNRSSLNSSKSREIGRFTRVTQRQSRSLSRNSQNFCNPLIIPSDDTKRSQKQGYDPFAVENCRKIHQKQEQEKHTSLMKEREQQQQKQIKLNVSKNKKNIHEKQSLKSDEIQLYLPTYQQIQSSNSYLLQQNDEDEITEQRNRMKREFQELIIMEKNANEQQRGIIREQINALSQMLGIMPD